MPFTVTHVLAVVPVHYYYRRFLFSALAIGAMIPDLPMFFPLSSYTFSHSLIGLFLFCLPLGMFAYYFYEMVLKCFVIDILPVKYASRLQGYRVFYPTTTATQFCLIVTAILIGSLTHLIWDAFTHQSGWMVLRMPKLQAMIGLFSWQLPLYKIIQYGSSIVGLPLLAILAYRSIHRLPAAAIEKANIISIKIKLPLFIGILLAPFLLGSYHALQHQSLYVSIGFTIRESIGFALMLLSIYAVSYRLIASRRSV